jgi:hypothetical protein
VTSGIQRVPVFTPGSRSHPEQAGTTGSRSHPGFHASSGSPFFRSHPDIYNIYIYVCICINNQRNNFGYGDFLRNKLHVHNKFDTSTLKLRFTLRHNKYVRCAHGAVGVTLVPHLLTPVRRNWKYVPVLRRRCVQMSLVHMSLLPKEDVRQFSKPRGGKHSPIFT